jgi:hypothetical protein
VIKVIGMVNTVPMDVKGGTFLFLTSGWIQVGPDVWKRKYTKPLVEIALDGPILFGLSFLWGEGINGFAFGLDINLKH